MPGVEHWDGTAYHRALGLPGGHGTMAVTPVERTPGRAAVRTVLRLADWRDLAAAVRRVRRLLDLEADPVAIDDALGADPALAPWIAKVPGRRVPGSVDVFETAVKATIGQQISVAGARTVAGRIVAAAGEPLTIDDGPLTHVWPTPAALAAIDLDAAADAAQPAAHDRRALASRRPAASSCSTPASTATRSAPACSTCPASVRGPPATC